MLTIGCSIVIRESNKYSETSLFVYFLFLFTSSPVLRESRSSFHLLSLDTALLTAYCSLLCLLPVAIPWGTYSAQFELGLSVVPSDKKVKRTNEMTIFNFEHLNNYQHKMGNTVHVSPQCFFYFAPLITKIKPWNRVFLSFKGALNIFKKTLGAQIFLIFFTIHSLK